MTDSKGIVYYYLLASMLLAPDVDSQQANWASFSSQVAKPSLAPLITRVGYKRANVETDMSHEKTIILNGIARILPSYTWYRR